MRVTPIRILGVVVVAAASLVATPLPANALSGAAVCGSATYHLVYAKPIKNVSGSTIGSLSISSNNRGDQWCAVTIRTTGSSYPVYMMARMALDPDDLISGNWATDQGTYVTYAGPVYKTWEDHRFDNLVVEGQIANTPKVQVWCDLDGCGPPV